MIRHLDINDAELKQLIRQQLVRIGGNRKLKIYGALRCTSGKRMKKENRIFFSSENEAVNNGYRPCGHCMKQAYARWKQQVLREHDF